MYLCKVLFEAVLAGLTAHNSNVAASDRLDCYDLNVATSRRFNCYYQKRLPRGHKIMRRWVIKDQFGY
jgi:hypothetical protein